MKQNLDVLHLLRGSVLAAISFLSWYFLAGVRTSDFGAPLTGVLRMSLYFYIFAALCVAVVFWGGGLRRIFLTALAMTLFCVGGSEAFGRAQEWLLMRKHGERPEHSFVVRRWAPFQHHNLGYVKDTRWWGCD